MNSTQSNDDVFRTLPMPTKINGIPEYMLQLSKPEFSYAVRHALIISLVVTFSGISLLMVLDVSYVSPLMGAIPAFPLTIFLFKFYKKYIMRKRDFELNNGFWRFLAIKKQQRTGRGPFVLTDGYFDSSRNLIIKKPSRLSTFKEKIMRFIYER